jgi:hypothetical protein
LGSADINGKTENAKGFAMKRDKIMIIAMVMGVLLYGCGGEKKSSADLSCSNFLPDEIAQTEKKRSSEVRTFKGESLFEYIDGGAEIYHAYNFIEVATANYGTNGIETVVDIYRFENSDNAYGLFASFRPDNPVFVPLGAEGFGSPTSIDFVKGPFVVRIIGFAESAETAQAISVLASEINAILPADDNLPQKFSFFPQGDYLDGTDRIFAQSFLGQKFLTDVYSRKYHISGDTLTLFITEDVSGEKFSLWFEFGVADGSAEPAREDLIFDDGRAFIIENNYYGRIVTGLKGEHLIGVINYSDDKKDFLTEWLDSIY